MDANVCDDALAKLFPGITGQAILPASDFGVGKSGLVSMRFGEYSEDISSPIEINNWRDDRNRMPQNNFPSPRLYSLFLEYARQIELPVSHWRTDLKDFHRRDSPRPSAPRRPTNESMRADIAKLDKSKLELDIKLPTLHGQALAWFAIREGPAVGKEFPLRSNLPVACLNVDWDREAFGQALAKFEDSRLIWLYDQSDPTIDNLATNMEENRSDDPEKYDSSISWIRENASVR